MRLNVTVSFGHLHVGLDQPTLDVINAILARQRPDLDGVRQDLAILTKAIHAMNDKVDALRASDEQLTADVTAETTVVQSAIVLLNGFGQRLADALQAARDAGVPDDVLADFAALHASVTGNTDALAAAVTANTAQAAEPTPAPTTTIEPAPEPAPTDETPPADTAPVDEAPPAG